METNYKKKPFNLPLKRLAKETSPGNEVYALQALLKVT
jgi:hypothetical protein